MFTCIGLSIMNIHKHVKMLSYRAGAFSFQLPVMLGNQMGPQPFSAMLMALLNSHGSQLSTMAPAGTPPCCTAPHSIPLISAVIQPQGPSPNYLSTVHIDLASAFTLTCFSANGHHHSPVPKGPSPPLKPAQRPPSPHPSLLPSIHCN